MKTWNDLKQEIKNNNLSVANDLTEIEILAIIVTTIIDRRKQLGYSQRDLAEICGLPQSSIARIENNTVTPNVETLLKIMKPLGLTLVAVSI